MGESPYGQRSKIIENHSRPGQRNRWIVANSSVTSHAKRTKDAELTSGLGPEDVGVTTVKDTEKGSDQDALHPGQMEEGETEGREPKSAMLTSERSWGSRKRQISERTSPR
jgi:hypothetical protein